MHLWLPAMVGCSSLYIQDIVRIEVPVRPFPIPIDAVSIASAIVVADKVVSIVAHNVRAQEVIQGIRRPAASNTPCPNFFEAIRRLFSRVA